MKKIQIADPTRQNPAKSWPDPTRPDSTWPVWSIRPVDNSALNTAMNQIFEKDLSYPG